MSIPPLILTVPAALGLALLLTAAVRAWGGRLVVTVSIGVVLFFFVKEFLNIRGLLLNHHYQLDRTFVQLGKVPLTVLLGHLYTFWTGILIAERLHDALPSLKRGFAVHFVCVFAAAGAMAYLMEVIGIAAGWWHWTGRSEWSGARGLHGFPDHIIIAPEIAIVGWILYMSMCYAAFFVSLWALDRLAGPRGRFFAPLPMLLIFIPVFRDRHTRVAAALLTGSVLAAGLGRLFDWSPLIEQKPYKAAWAGRVARAGFAGAMALTIGVGAFVLFDARGTIDPRAWVCLLPLSCLAIASSGRAAFIATGAAAAAAAAITFAAGWYFLAFACAYVLVFYFLFGLAAGMQLVRDRLPWLNMDKTPQT